MPEGHSPPWRLVWPTVSALIPHSTPWPVSFPNHLPGGGVVLCARYCRLWGNLARIVITVGAVVPDCIARNCVYSGPKEGLDSIFPDSFLPCSDRVHLQMGKREGNLGNHFVIFPPWERTTLESYQMYMITDLVLIDLQRRQILGLFPQEAISTFKNLQ